MQLNGKRFYIFAMGCRSNQYEGEALASALRAKGAILSIEHPDIIIVVTCTITSQADMKTRKLFRKLRKKNNEAYIVATGCYAQGACGSDLSSLGVDLLVGNRLKHRIVELIEEYLGSDRRFNEVRTQLADNQDWDRLQLDTPGSHARAFIKIQDGCNHGCSYCIVPSVRGMPSSRDPQDILLEVQRVVDSGCVEVVLTGIHLGLYSYDGISLANLIIQLGKISGLKRLRLGSIEPLAVTQGLVAVLAETSCFCPHLHIPLQSGDDAVLNRMRRGYNRHDFYKIVEQSRTFLGENTHFSTDLMIGFPGETREAFQNSLQLLNQLKFGKIHVFPYSARKGTLAYDMENQIPAEVIKERTAEALEFSSRQLDSYAESWIGKPVSILVEKAQKTGLEGWTKEYIRAITHEKSVFARRDQVELLVFSSKQGCLFGDIISAESCVNQRDSSFD